MALKMTEERAELLVGVRSGDVWKMTNGESMRTSEGQYGETLFERVSQQMADMEAAGWVEVVELAVGSRLYELTDAGRKALAAATRKAG